MCVFACFVMGCLFRWFVCIDDDIFFCRPLHSDAGCFMVDDLDPSHRPSCHSAAVVGLSLPEVCRNFDCPLESYDESEVPAGVGSTHISGCDFVPCCCHGRYGRFR